MNILRKIEELRDFSKKLYVARKGMLTENDFRHLYLVAGLDARIGLWLKNGMKTFIPSKELIGAFRHTDVSFDLFPSDFRYPFPSFVIESADAPLYETNMPYGVSPVYAILYTEDTAVYHDPKCLLVAFDGKRRDRLDWNRSIYGLFPGHEGLGVEGIILNMNDDRTVREAVDTKIEATMLPMDGEDARNLVNMFYNAIRYINDPTRVSTETETCGTRKMKTGHGQTYANRYIRLAPPKNYRPLPVSSDGRTVDVRFVVRGHWRNQAIGKRDEGQHRRT